MHISGFSGDGHACVDVDECDLGTHNCSQSAICQNTRGHYQCECYSNFVGDGQHCASVHDLETHGFTVNCSNLNMVFTNNIFANLLVDPVVNEDWDSNNNTGNFPVFKHNQISFNVVNKMSVLENVNHFVPNVFVSP